MPGLCLATGDGAADRRDDLESALDRRLYFDRYRRAVVREDDETWLGYTTYPGYPTRVFERDGLTCYLEGAMYGGRASDDELRSVAETLLDPDAPTDGVADWLADVDGDFVLCAVDEASGDVAVLNDVFGRLPLYYAADDEGVALARDPGFLLDVDDYAFDRTSLATVLTFGYTLGDRTLWTEIEQVPPGSAVLLRDETPTVERLHEFDFDEKRHADRSTSENAAEMARLFREACERRSRLHETNVVSLSGGHDSRAVAAAFHDADRPWTAATFVRGGNDESSDSRIARDVADALGVEWERYDLPPVRGAEMRTLLRIKSGLNHLGMSFILAFFEELRDRHGPWATYLTGDGGDKAVPDLSPPREFDDLTDLADYAIAQNAVFSLADAADIAGVDEDRVRGEVESVLDAYPESDFGNKYVHFLVHERGFNWLFEGEDRNRHYLWSTTPFYSTEFFRYAMNVPDEQKAKNDLYREFLSALWAPSVEFADADFATPMASPRYPLIQFGLETLDRHPRLASVAQTLYNGELGSSYHENLADLLRQQRARCDALNDVLDGQAVDDVASNRSAYDRQAAFTLLTLTSAIDTQACGTPVSAVPDDEFE